MARLFLEELFAAAVAAAAPAACVPQALPARPSGRTVVFAYGKAAASMAATVEACWDGPLEGIAVTRYGHGVPLKRIRLIEASHPYGDEAGAGAARAMLALAHELGPDDLALCLVSGGGSALINLPAEDIRPEEKRAVFRQLLACGAPIDAINAVRRRLSAIKGGRLAAAAAPAHVHSLVISDVPGDNPAVVASGPSFPEPPDGPCAREILKRYAIEMPPSVADFLARPAAPVVLGSTSNAVVACARTALDAAATLGRNRGIDTVIVSDRIEGEASDVGARHAAVAREIARGGGAPKLLLSGGETSVTVAGKGRGGRNAEYLAALAIGIDGLNVSALAADTDGIDGSEDNAGALADGSTMSRAKALGLDPVALLADNDAYTLFAALGDLVVTGPTRTNVNDFRSILIGDLPS